MRAGHPGWAVLQLDTPAFGEWAHREQARLWGAARLPLAAAAAFLRR